LSNGKIIHNSCYEELKKDLTSKQKLYSDRSKYISELKERDDNKLQKQYYSAYLNRIPPVNKRLLNDISTFEERNVRLQTQIDEIKERLLEIHSYWLGYPPDWEERRRLVIERAGNRCEKCKYDHGEKHVHHKIPVSKGGNHLLSNLIYYCLDCHKDSHGGRDVSADNDDIDSYYNEQKNQIELKKKSS
jgi:hypothetical protein